MLLIKEKAASGATVDDAETLARYEWLQPGTIAFNDFVADASA
jgi:hypothetical protein